MKKIFLILFCFLLLSCNSGNNHVEENPLVLDFPANEYIDSVIYLGCDELIFSTPASFNFLIFEDTIIDLNQFDNRLNLKLKFNWKYVNYFDIGVISIDVMKNDKAISNIDLRGVITVEAFPYKNAKSDRYMQTVSDDIYMVDINLDSYLDIKVRSFCGKGCYYSYWIFNPNKNVFELDKSLDSMRPYYVDCNNKLIYSYEGGTAWYNTSRAYKVYNGKIAFFQSYYQEHYKSYSIYRYNDANGEIIQRDSIINKTPLN